LTELLRSGARQLIADAVEAELQELLGQDTTFRNKDSQRQIVRNGYLPERGIQTGIGPVKIRVPKIRDKCGQGIKFNSAILPPCLRKTLLDGCYVIKSDVPEKDAATQKLHARYCDLEMVERAFRTMKTTHLELRPVFVKKKTSTQGHVFVVMLALLLQKE